MRVRVRGVRACVFDCTLNLLPLPSLQHPARRGSCAAIHVVAIHGTMCAPPLTKGHVRHQTLDHSLLKGLAQQRVVNGGAGEPAGRGVEDEWGNQAIPWECGLRLQLSLVEDARCCVADTLASIRFAETARFTAGKRSTQLTEAAQPPSPAGTAGHICRKECQQAHLSGLASKSR